MTVALLIPLALAARLLALALTLALARHPGQCRAIGLLGAALCSLLTGAAGAAVVLGHAPVQGVLLVHPASGLSLGYALLPLSGFFLVVLATLAIPALLYSIGYLGHAVPPRRTAFVVAGLDVLLLAMEAVFVADGVVGFLFAWELMTLAAAALVATDHEHADNRRAAFLFLVLSHVGTGCLLAGFWTLSALAGSLSFSAVLSGHLAAGPLRHVLFALFLAGFGVKAGMIPLHIWLPEAHPAAPSSISALMSGALITTGLYGLLRVCVLGLGVPAWDWGVTLVLLGSLSALLGVLYALTQNDLKRLLAYSTIENAGIVLMGLGTAMMALASGGSALAALAIAASLFHVLNHAVFKGLLFLGAGGVATGAGTRRLEEMGGLVKRMPWTALFFLVGAASASGLPPLNGFAGEWLLFQALLQGFHSTPSLSRLIFPLAGALLALTSALAATCFVKAFGAAFLALPRGEGAKGARESGGWMLLPQALLAVLCLVLGLLPGGVLALLQGVVASLPGVRPDPALARGLLAIAPGAVRFDHLTPALVAAAVGLGLLGALAVASRGAVRRAPTWGCGGELTAQAEYSASAFSKPLVMVFKAVYRPTREVTRVGEAAPYFPSGVRFRAEIEPTFERFVYEPLTRAVLGLAERMKVIQAGSLHAYLAYVLVLGIALLLWLGGAR